MNNVILKTVNPNNFKRIPCYGYLLCKNGQKLLCDVKTETLIFKKNAYTENYIFMIYEPTDFDIKKCITDSLQENNILQNENSNNTKNMF